MRTVPLGEALGDDAKLPVASERAMCDFGRHSSVIAQLALPTGAENSMQVTFHRIIPPFGVDTGC